MAAGASSDDDFVPIEELARLRDVTSIASVGQLAQPGLWEKAGLRAFFGTVVVLPCTLQAATVGGEIQAAARLRGRHERSTTPGSPRAGLDRDVPVATLNTEDYVDFAEHEGLELVR